MDFQEAIELVLARSPRPMSSTEIAEAINERKLYLEWKGKPVSAALVYGRASQHFTFSINNGLISLSNEDKDSENILRQLSNAILQSRQANAEIILPFLLLWARVTSNETFLAKQYFGKFTFHEYSKIEFPVIKKDYWHETVRYFVENISFEANILQDYLENILLLSDLDQALVEIVQNSGISKKNQSDKEFSIFFNTLIKNLFNGNGVQHISNDSLSHIFRKIIGDYQFESLFAPFAGSASVICDINANSETSIYLQEINHKAAFGAWMNIVLAGFKRFDLKPVDSLIYPPNKQFDLIISDPPLGLKSNGHWNNLDYIFIRNTTKFESSFIQMILSRLNSNGKAIIVVPESVLSAKSYLSLREYLVNNDLLHSIITSKVEINQYRKIYKFNILVLDCCKPESKKDKVLLQELVGMNMSELNVVSLTQAWDLLPETSIIIENAQIRNNEYHLIVSDFFNLKRLPDGNLKLLKDLIISYSAGSSQISFAATKKEFAVEPNCIPFVSTNDLSSSASNFILDVEKVEKCVVNNGNLIKPKDLIDYEAVLIARNANSLRPTYFDGRCSILVSWNIFVLRLDTQEILPEYLISQFHEDYVRNQIENIKSGSAHSFLDSNRLLRVLIKIVSRQEQENLLKDYYKNVVSKTELLVIQESKKVVESEITLLASLEHELRGQVLNQLVQEISNVRNFLDRKSDENSIFSWEDKLILTPKSRKIKDAFSHLDEVVNTATQLFDNMQSIIKLDENKLKKSKINLISFIKDEVEKFGDELKDIHIWYSFDFTEKSNIQVEIDIDKFSNVISNFVRNTIQHAFDETIQEKYLVFNVSKNEFSSEVIIDMLDNGKGFPNDFNFDDYKSFGVNSNSKGSGIGGYLLYRSIKIHNGFIELLDKGNVLYIPTQESYPFTHKRGKNNEKKMSIKTGVHFRIVLPS